LVDPDGEADGVLAGGVFEEIETDDGQSWRSAKAEEHLVIEFGVAGFDGFDECEEGGDEERDGDGDEPDEGAGFFE
jgi:hypothetical protein